MIESSQKSMVKEMTFVCDGLKLSATLHLPEAKRPPVVIGCHGLFSDRNSPKQIALARECNRYNLGFLRIDHRGCGDSQGDFNALTVLEARCRDLIKAIELMKTREDTGDRIGLFGSSMGGAVSLAVAGKLGLAPIVTVAAPIMSKHIQDTGQTPQAPHHGGFKLDIKKNSFDITNMLSGISNILIFHGERDNVVPLDHAREIFQGAGDPKKLIIQKDGDHRMSNPVHQHEFVREASLWFRNGLSE